ncbi:hypothetical protein D9756_001574 [Leucocoprinus leucothites]|uniref:Uncharacterized protein n=1 Tax=Leucocoprinus leucothites TaxID=201217 RepID=A0A8H5LIA3_9AGAR|nr:hypothetical protein D9756_001574 [Leucoagaricus leucothites]
MPPRSKPSAKTDSSQAKAVSHRRTTKRPRVYSDEDEGEGYELNQERRTSYNESYARGGAGGSSPPAQGERQKLSAHTASGSEDGEESDYEAQMRDYDGARREEEVPEDNAGYTGRDEAAYMEDDDGADGYAGGRLSKKRRASVSSPLTGSSWRDSSPPAASAPAQTSTAIPSSSGHAQPSARGRVRRPSMKARQMTSTATTKKSTTKGKHKAQSASSSKRKRKQGEESEDEEEYNDYEDEEVNVDEDEEEARLSDNYDDYEEEERPTRGKKGRGGGGKGSKTREKEKDMAPILKKAKLEGNPGAVSSTATTTTTATSTKRPRAKKATGEDTIVDIMDETGTPDPSSIGSPAATNATDGGKDDTPASSAPPAKKRKLPTIKKLKSTASLGGVGGSSGGTGTGPSTPSSGMATGSKPPGLPPPPPGGVAGNGVNILGIAEGSKPRPKTNATSDLDLSNPSLYAELFKNPGSNNSRTGLNRRAKEEERKKELDKMREEYKARFADESKKSFDLQGQAEKMARFEEVLRHRRSSALYPNFLAAKWREEWEREKRRAERRDYQPPSLPNGHVDNTKEEGEM